MIKKIQHKLLMIILSCSLQQSLYTDWRESFKGREWEFLQYMIRTRYEQNWANRKSSNFLAIGGIIAGFYGLYRYLAMDLDPSRNRKDYDKDGLYGSSTILASVITIFYYCSQKIQATHKLTFNQFIQDWPSNKQYVPECFHNLLDDCYKVYQQHGVHSSEYNCKRYEATLIIGQALYNKFPPPIQINYMGNVVQYQ